MNNIVYTKGGLLGSNNFTVPGNVLQDNMVYWWNMKVNVMWLCTYSWPNCISGASGSCDYYSVPFRLYTRFNPTSVNNISENVPEQFSLLQNYPNPFNPITSIKFEIPRSQFVTITISDALGREVETIVNIQLNPGTYQVDWDAADYPSGVYYYKITADEYTETKKMVLIK